jgi:flagellar hook protein FlgE
MGLTSAMFTGLTGLNANQLIIDTAGDNIANVNTTAFKSNRATFENQFAITIAGGTPPNETSGGTNPSQVGRGTALGSIQRNFEEGALETTGIPTDMAIEGNGLFVVQTPNQGTMFTRDGTFRLDASNTMVTADGFRLQGYGVDVDGNIVQDTLGDINIPLGELNKAQATSLAEFDGNLNANGTLATQGTMIQSQAFVDGGGQPATDASLLTALSDAGNPGVPLFAEGDVITVANAKKGGRQLPEATYTVTANSTLGDYTQFLQNHLGISQDAAAGGTPGVRVSTDADAGGAGRILIEGNPGEDNAIELNLSSIRSSSLNFPAPLQWNETQEANGESVFTSFVAYDSLGTPVQVDLTLTLVQKTDAGPTWRFYAESYDDTDVSPVLGNTGTITFDNDGQLTATDSTEVQIDRNDTGALTPLVMDLNFDAVTGLTTEDSTAVMTRQDGYPTGTLNNFAVGTDGVIIGSFTNGLTETLGQVAMAVFNNSEGLILQPNNMYTVGPNSGQPLITTPETLGAGRVLSGALELSNVDLTREFIGLITATTGFSANGRVISTSNDLLNELLLIAR